MEQSKQKLCKTVFDEYEKGNLYKAGLGEKGLFEQNKINRRFYIGDHWHGAKCGNDRPLVRRNIIRRIADYKLSSIGSAPVAVNFSAEGIENTVFTEESSKENYNQVVSGKKLLGGKLRDDSEITTAMQILTSYGQCTMERLNFSALSAEVLKNAYVTGTGILYTYFDENAVTGLYADASRSTPIKGDIACEVVDIENVVFGDNERQSVQEQPYIIIGQRRGLDEVRREAQKNGMSAEEVLKLGPDNDFYMNRSWGDYSDSNTVTVLTKFYKEWNETGDDFRVMCIRCTQNAVIKEPFDIGIKLYPIAKLTWDNHDSLAYGESEITYIIPNQIAINRALSAEVWGCMLTGMPILLQNGDIISQEITNDPGQVIKVYGDESDVSGAVSYIEPPSFADQMIKSVNELANNTLSDLGATDAALGNIRPDNASAIIQVREAALQPMQLKQNKYYTFIEDVMRIWAQFWVNFYGERKLKIKSDKGTAYVPFEGSRYADLLINARVDVGASTVWSTAVVISTLDALLSEGIITPVQYLERIPSGIIPDKTRLISELKSMKNTSDEAQGRKATAKQNEMIKEAAYYDGT